MAGLGALGGGGLLGGQSLAALGAGLLAGVIGGGALVASGTVDFTPAATGGGGTAGGAGLELVPCPDQGPVIGSIPRNQQVLVTGRSEDSRWLKIYWPAPGLESDAAWTLAGPLQLEGDLASLPVARCETPPTPTPRPTVEPTPTPAPTPTPTATPTPTPSPSPTPTGTPRPNAGPRLSGLAASTATISYDTDRYCASAAKSTVISVTATDADGIDSVMLHFRAPGAGSYAMKPMTLSGGRYVATLDTTADNLKAAGELRYYVSARDKDADAATTRTPKSGYKAVTVKVCKNTGPKVTSLVASPSSIIANPLDAQCSGSTLSEFQAKATDVDGVKGVRLFFKKPGASSYTSRAFSKDGDTWYSYINTVSSVDNIVRSGTISWYVEATDGKGVKSKTSTKSMRVTRCDTEAAIRWASITPDPLYIGQYCSPTYPTMTLPIAATDADNGAGDSRRLRVTVAWRVVTASGVVVGSDTTPATWISGRSFQVMIPTSSKWLTGERSFSINFTVRTTDIYGGTTTVSGKDSFLVAGCVG